jgi:hypothetical protein
MAAKVAGTAKKDWRERVTVTLLITAHFRFHLTP